MNAINSYIIDIIEALRTFLFWGGAAALLGCRRILRVLPSNSKAPCIAWCNCDAYWDTASFANHYLCVAFLIHKRIEEK